jgi:hypothetical protein
MIGDPPRDLELVSRDSDEVVERLRHRHIRQLDKNRLLVDADRRSRGSRRPITELRSQGD